MIRCPNCGSTAQVRHIGFDVLETEKIGVWESVDEYKCGCGCEFKRIVGNGKTKIVVEN